MIIEPPQAVWNRGPLRVGASVKEQQITVVNTSPAGILSPAQVEDLEALLLNARLWLVRATTQADELAAAADLPF